jgi:hypothetical protein
MSAARKLARNSQSLGHLSLKGVSAGHQIFAPVSSHAPG